MKPFINILFGALLVVLVGVGQVRGQCIQNGEGTDNTLYAPFETVSTWRYMWMEMIYITDIPECDIISISYDCVTSGNTQLDLLNIYIGHTNRNTHISNTDWQLFDELTKIYSRTNTSVGATIGWETFIFDEPWHYNGEDNIVIVIQKKQQDHFANTYYSCSSSSQSILEYSGTDEIKSNYPGNNSGSSYSWLPNIKFCFDNPLPITLTSFNAVCAGRSSYIYWTTATETNNDYFILEHSTDAINFQEVTRIPGAGTSIEPNDYNYIDYNATSEDNYYRLVQVDYDGTRTPSEIIYANCMDDHLVYYEEPRAYIDNGIVLVAGDRLCDVYVYTILGAQRYTKRMYPGETGRLNYWGHYIVEFVWVDENTYDIRKKVYKLFNIE